MSAPVPSRFRIVPRDAAVRRRGTSLLLGLAGVAAFYLVAYRRVALLGPLFDRRSPEATSGA